MFTGEKPDLLDICPLREDSIYVVGKDGIPQHYDGEDWTPVRTDNTNPLMGIWAAHENDIYAVGIGGVVLHYEGKDWKAIDRELRLAKLDLRVQFGSIFHIRGGGARVVLERPVLGIPGAFNHS